MEEQESARPDVQGLGVEHLGFHGLAEHARGTPYART